MGVVTTHPAVNREPGIKQEFNPVVSGKPMKYFNIPQKTLSTCLMQIYQSTDFSRLYVHAKLRYFLACKSFILLWCQPAFLQKQQLMTFGYLLQGSTWCSRITELELSTGSLKGQLPSCCCFFLGGAVFGKHEKLIFC